MIETGVLRRLLAFTELKFSNSMIEAWWRFLNHQWLFLHAFDSISTVRRLVAFYVDEHNRVPHSAFRGQTPGEMYFGTGETMPADLHHARPPRAKHALRPIDRRRAPDARQSTRPRDPCSDHRDPRAHASGGEAGKNRGQHVSRVDGQNPVWDQRRRTLAALAAPATRTRAEKCRTSVQIAGFVSLAIHTRRSLMLYLATDGDLQM